MATAAKITSAEKRARSYADKLEAAGWDVHVSVTYNEPHRFRSGEIITDGFTQAFVAAHREWYDGSITFSFHTAAGLQPGRRATTSYGRTGERRTASGKVHKLTDERKLSAWVSTLCMGRS